jgi:hypothetical protein
MPFEGTPKEAATHLLAEANKQRIQFPKLMDDAKRLQVCGATVVRRRNNLTPSRFVLYKSELKLFGLQMLHKEDGTFNIEEAVQSLIEKYGQAPEEEEKAGKTKKKRKSDAAMDGEDDGEEKEKKVRKVDQIANEDNRPLAEAIKEIADINFKQKEMRTGGTLLCLLPAKSK